MNKNKIWDIITTLILTSIFTAIIIIGINKVFCLGFLSKCWVATKYTLVQHGEYNQKYTNLNTTFTNYVEILNYYYNNQEKIKYCIVKLKNPEPDNTKFFFYYKHYFLQLYIENYPHCLNYPFTKTPLMGDSYYRILLEDSKGNSLSHCLTANATVTEFNTPLAYSVIPENIQLSIKNKEEVTNNMVKLIKTLIPQKK